MTEGDNPTIRRGQWERLVRGWPIPKREKAVALGAGTYANADGTKVKPSVKTLAQSTGYSTRSVKYALRNLREWRFLTVAVESRWVQGQPGSAPREYRLTAPNRLPSELGLGAWCNPLHPTVPRQNQRQSDTWVCPPSHLAARGSTRTHPSFASLTSSTRTSTASAGPRDGRIRGRVRHPSAATLARPVEAHTHPAAPDANGAGPMPRPTHPGAVRSRPPRPHPTAPRPTQRRPRRRGEPTMTAAHGTTPGHWHNQTSPVGGGPVAGLAPSNATQRRDRAQHPRVVFWWPPC